MSPITLFLSAMMVLVGIGMIVRTLVAGGGGLLFMAAGAGRIWAERRR
jgi:hypothetical protein